MRADGRSRELWNDEGGHSAGDQPRAEGSGRTASLHGAERGAVPGGAGRDGDGGRMENWWRMRRSGRRKRTGARKHTRFTSFMTGIRGRS